MTGMQLKFSKFKFDSSNARAKARVKLENLMKDVARVFILECINRVPVATGMAKQSLRPLANWLASIGRSVRFNVTPNRRGRWAEARYALGPLLGKPEPFLVVRANQYGVTSLTFEWGTDVPHWTVNPGLEWNSNPNGGQPAWEAIESGMKMARDFIDNYSANYMPDMFDLDLTWEDV